MKNKFRWVILALFFGMSMFIPSIGTVLGADPTVGNIRLNPDKPTPQSVVTFSVDISGGSIQSVRILLNECDKDKGICHVPPQNVSMTKKSGNTYEAKVTLKWDDVTSITYHIELKSNGKWIRYDDHTTFLSTHSGSSNDSPGFEIAIIFILIIGFVLYFKKFNSK